MATTYGYARVSTREQNLDRQLAALEQFGVKAERVFADKASGKDFERPQWRELVSVLSEGDTLVVKSIDRLGRDYEEIQQEWHNVTKVVGAHVVVLDIPLLDTRPGGGALPEAGLTGTLIADIVLQLLSYLAQMEREGIRQRQAEGIAAAKQRGVRFGRPRIEPPESYPAVRAQYREGEISMNEAAKELGVSPSTFARWLKHAC